MGRAIIIAAALWTTGAAAESFSLTAPGDSVAFGRLVPGQDNLALAPARVHVVSTNSRWTLKVRSSGDLSSAQTNRKLPASRLSFQTTTADSLRHRMSQDEVIVLSDQPPTSEAGRLVEVEFWLRAEWGDHSLPAGDGYRSNLVFTVTPDEDRAHRVSPTPFSPNGDGVLDASTFEFTLDSALSVTVSVVDAQGRRIRQLLANAPLEPGIHQASWDGTSSDGTPAPDGSYQFELSGNDGRVLAREEVQVERTPRSGTGTLTGTVQARGEGPLPGVAVTLRTVGGLEHATVTTGSDGRFTFTGVGSGLFVLTAKRDLYLPYESPAFELPEGAFAQHDIELVHNHSLIVGLTASRDRAGVGDLVAIEATVRAVGTTSVEQLQLSIDVPPGLQPVPKSLTIDEVPSDQPLRALKLTPLEIGAAHRVRFLAAVTHSKGPLITSASAKGLAGGEPAEAGPATVKIDLLRNELSGDGGLFGRLCLDVDGDGACGPQDFPAANAVVFLEEGSYAESDRQGRYHFAPVRPGWHQLLGGPGPLRPGLRPGSPPELPREHTASRSVFLPAGQYQLVDLALPVPPGWEPPQPIDPDEGDLILPLDRGPKTKLVRVAQPEEDEGSLDESGRIVIAPVKYERVEISEGELLTEDPDAAEAKEARRPGGAVVGIGEGRLHAPGLTNADPIRLVPDGRLAFNLQQDLWNAGRLSVVVDTSREGDARRLATLDPRAGYRDLGDEGTTVMSLEEKLYVRLDLPALSVTAGRLSSRLHEGELIASGIRFLGAEVEVGNPNLSARVFSGYTAELELEDTLQGRDATGPYQLSTVPVAPGSEEVFIELRTESGELRQRIPQQRGVDYVIDYVRGVIDLAQPLAARSQSGDPMYVAVRYHSTDEQLFKSALVAGVRARLGNAENHLGLTALHQRGPGHDLSAAAIDGRVKLGFLTAEGAVGVSDPDDRPLLDSSAARLKLTAQLGDHLELFGMGMRTGSDWEPRIQSNSAAPSFVSPFMMLEGSRGLGTLTLPVLGMVVGEVDTFPFMLPEETDRIEVGGGIRATTGPVRGVALYRRDWRPGAVDEARDRSEFAVSGRLGKDAVTYAAYSTSAQTLEREAVLGGRAKLGDVAFGLDVRHRDPQDDTNIRFHDVSLKLRHERWTSFQPSALAAVGLLQRPEGFALSRELALGIESEPISGLRAFAYGFNSWVDQGGPAARQGAFAGVQLSRGRGQRIAVRYELRLIGDEVENHLAWDGRMPLTDDLSIASDGRFRVGSEDRFARLTLAYRPTGPLSALARVQEERELWAGDLAPLTRLASVDLGFRVNPRMLLGARYLFRNQTAEGYSSNAGVTSAGVTAALAKNWDVVVSGRHLRDAAGDAVGGTVEAGHTLFGVLRLAAGVNVATREEVFSVERQPLGFFLNLGMRYGGALGSPTAGPDALDPTMYDELPGDPRPLGTQPPEIIAGVRTEPAGRHRVRGRVYRDINGNKAWDEDEPVFGEMKVAAAGVEAVTDKQGRFVLDGVPSGTVQVEVVDRGSLPFGYAVAEAETELGAVPEAIIDLHVGSFSLPIGSDGAYRADLGSGPVRLVPIERVRFPLVAWAAGMPLSERESEALARLAERVMQDKSHRLLVLTHAQSSGPLRGAWRRALSGTQALQRYLRAVQLVPASRIAATVVEPLPGIENALGEIELVLVKIAQ